MIKTYNIDIGDERIRLEISEGFTKAELLTIKDFINQTMQTLIDEAKKQSLTADSPIEDLDLSIRSYNICKRAGINRIGDFCKYSRSELLGLRNFNERCLTEIKEKLGDLVELKEEE